jgi:hypothetical protein
MNNPVVDFYRCPEGLVNLISGGELSAGSGYFHFGPDAVCYGQASVGTSPTIQQDGLRDLSQDVTQDGLTLRLPFDLSQIVDNLRRERYAASAAAGNSSLLSSEAFQRTYYHLRPLFGVRVRKHIQRLFHRKWDQLLFPAWPVDRTVEQVLERVLILSMQAQKRDRIPFIWFWPEGAPSCAIVTHDLETKAGLDLAPSLMDVDETFGVKGSFQVIPEGQYSVSMHFLDTVRARGFEVNVHDLRHDGNLFDNRAQFMQRVPSINRYFKEYGAKGFRAGRMYRNTEWYDALDMSYDMSVPNVAHLEPQRGGCCTVFPYFIGRIVELPLTTIQDYCLFHILGEYSIELWKKQIELVTEKHGLVSFIVHPDYVMEPKALRVYRTLLGYLSELRNAGKVWMALPREVDQWWRERNQMKLAYDDGVWRIEGPGRERARVAYATLAGDSIRYTFDQAASQAASNVQ